MQQAKLNNDEKKYTLAEAFELLSDILPDVDVPLSWDPCVETIDLTEEDSSDDDYSDSDDDHPEFRPRSWTKKEVKEYRKFQKENKKPVA